MASRGAGIVVQDDLCACCAGTAPPSCPPPRACSGATSCPTAATAVVTAMPQRFTSWDAIFRTLRSAFPDERYHAGSTLDRVRAGGPAGHGALRRARRGRGGPAGLRRRLPLGDAPAAAARGRAALRRLRRLARHGRGGARRPRAGALLRPVLHVLRGALGRAHPLLPHPGARRRDRARPTPPQLGVVRRRARRARARPAAHRPERQAARGLGAGRHGPGRAGGGDPRDRRPRAAPALRRAGPGRPRTRSCRSSSTWRCRGWRSGAPACSATRPSSCGRTRRRRPPRRRRTPRPWPRPSPPPRAIRRPRCGHGRRAGSSTGADSWSTASRSGGARSSGVTPPVLPGRRARWPSASAGIARPRL